jgi:hypothetical protein
VSLRVRRNVSHESRRVRVQLRRPSPPPRWRPRRTPWPSRSVARPRGSSSTPITAARTPRASSGVCSRGKGSAKRSPGQGNVGKRVNLKDEQWPKADGFLSGQLSVVHSARPGGRHV